MIPRRGLTLVALSLLLVATTALLGPSVATAPLPGGGWLPPYSLGLHPAALLVVGLQVAATLCGATGSWLCWRAVRDGWSPPPRRLLAAAAIAVAGLCLLPPTSSDDVYSYAAYGRMVALHRDPYTTTPADLGDDPVGRAAGEPWRDAPSVYGPVATAEQAVLLRVAGDDLRTAAFLLTLAAGLAFAGTALLLDATAPDDDTRRRRAVLFALNPLLLLHLVAGAHVDGLLVLLTVAAVVAARRPYLAGLLGGAATCVKLTGALVVAGLGWTRRRALVTAAAVVLAAYALAGGLTALGQARRASRYVSFASPWRLLASPLDHAIGRGASRPVVTALSYVLVVALLVVLARGLPPGPDAARAAAVATLAWLLGATYVLPWYDASAWALLALLAWSAWDALLLVRTTVLTLAYLPGRVQPLPGWLHGLLGAVRGVVAPVVLLALLVVAVRRCRTTTAAPA